MASGSGSVDEGSELPMNCKTWVLRVSIHCEGCKRKVKKILQSIKGVHAISIDSQQHKVTVTSEVDGETLVRKLVKSGKHAELLWPQKAEKKKEEKNPEKKEQNQSEAKNNEKNQKDPQSSKDANVEEEQSKKPVENIEVKLKSITINEGEAPVKKTTIEIPVQESKSDGKKPEISTAVSDSPATMVEEKKQSTESDAASEKSASGKVGKKKVKKGQKTGEIPREIPVEILREIPASTGSHATEPVSSSANLGHPRQHMNPYPSYGPPPPPVYVTSYSTAHPSSSYSGSFYVEPPMQPYTYSHPEPHPYTYSHAEAQQPYTYSHPEQYGTYSNPELQPYTYRRPGSPPTDSFTMFSDEDANGCAVM